MDDVENQHFAIDAEDEMIDIKTAVASDIPGRDSELASDQHSRHGFHVRTERKSSESATVTAGRPDKHGNGVMLAPMFHDPTVAAAYTVRPLQQQQQQQQQRSSEAVRPVAANNRQQHTAINTSLTGQPGIQTTNISTASMQGPLLPTDGMSHDTE